jgi:predicted nucleic acid-binding protein
MKIAITDANIFIDLIYIGLHEELFECGLEIHTSIDIYDELNKEQQKSISKFIKKSSLTLHVVENDKRLKLNLQSKGLSESDKSVLALAQELDAFILTGDALLRKISSTQKIEIHGIFWLLDRFLEQELIGKKTALKRLKNLISYNKRLPPNECQKRLNLWSK